MQFTFFLFSRSCALPCHSNLLLKAVAATQVRPNVRFGSLADICSALGMSALPQKRTFAAY